MSEQMPARIRVAQDADGFWTCREAISGSPEFIRADIAERMAAAMLASIDMIENCADAPKNPDSLPEMVKAHLQSALSAWRDDR